MNSLLLGSDLSLTAVLDASALTLRHRLGWPPLVAYLLVAPVMSVVMLFVVFRARKCLDFGATLYGYHLLFCWLYAGFPRNWEWWVVNLVSMTVMIVLAEQLCQRKELQDIPVSHILGASPTGSSEAASVSPVPAPSSSAPACALPPPSPAPSLGGLSTPSSPPLPILSQTTNRTADNLVEMV